MGVCRRYLLPKFRSIIENLDTAKTDLIELGDQDLNPDSSFVYNMKFRDLFKGSFKSWRTLDLQPVSGVEIFDLSALTFQEKCADIITNYGTSEHVEPERGQYTCWVNMHKFLRVGGVEVHALPFVGEWPEHCRYYYDFEFFKKFENCGYKILEMEITWSKLIYCVLSKVEDKDFMTYEQFMSAVTFKNMDSSKNIGSNNPKNITW